MYNYYDLDILPIILNRFKVHNIVICGMDDEITVNRIIEYCELNESSYVAIDVKNNSKMDVISEYSLNALPNLKEYDAIFINDDPNWYTVFNELEIIKENNSEFPLVFVCHNVFPHKRRDSYFNPDVIPDEYKHDFSKKFKYNDIFLSDGFFHAINENTPKNGVLTAIEDFLSENIDVGMMDIKLSKGITILYPNNNISKIRLGLLTDEISNHMLEFDSLSDFVVENQHLEENLSKLNLLADDFDSVDDIKFSLDEKEKIIDEYKEKIKIHNNEINYKNSQIEGADSKLNLKDAQIKNIESKLVNSENEILDLSNKLKNANNQISSLKNDLNQKIQNFENKEIEFNAQMDKFSSEINSLKINLAKKEQIEQDFNNKLNIANNQIKNNEEQLIIKENIISEKNNQIIVKQKELDNKDNLLNTVKNEYMIQLSKSDSKEYCITCYKEELVNNKSEIEYLRDNTFTRKLFGPFAYIYLFFKSSPKEFLLNLRLYKAIKNSKCFDIGYYLANNEDIMKSKWCKFFSPELHYVCNGFYEKRKFNKKYFNRNSKEELLAYIRDCP